MVRRGPVLALLLGVGALTLEACHGGLALGSHGGAVVAPAGHQRSLFRPLR
jgi:hypothetical protein